MLGRAVAGRALAAGLLGLLIGGASGTGSVRTGDTTTTPVPTTAEAPPNDATTTTVPAITGETPLLAASLADVPGYRLSDWSPSAMGGQVARFNASNDKILGAFSALTTHAVLKDNHIVASIDLYRLRDTSLDSGQVTDLLIDAYVLSSPTRTDLTVASTPVTVTTGDGFAMWTWVNDGIAHAVWDETQPGNQAFAYDYVADYIATEAGLPLPPPTASGPPPGGTLPVEDSDLATRLIPVGSFAYEDPSVDYVIDFYHAFSGSNLERGSIHAVVDFVPGLTKELVAVLRMLEAVDEVKANESAIADLVGQVTTGYGEGGTLEQTEIAGHPVTKVTNTYDDGTPAIFWIWAQKGVVYNVEALAGPSQVESYIQGLITGTDAA